MLDKFKLHSDIINYDIISLNISNNTTRLIVIEDNNDF